MLEFLAGVPCTDDLYWRFHCILVVFLPCSYMQGVLALNGVLSLQENTESSLRTLFGDDVGVAFFILGKLKYQLKHKPDAAK